jgi:hypothetical protein
MVQRLVIAQVPEFHPQTIRKNLASARVGLCACVPVCVTTLTSQVSFGRTHRDYSLIADSGNCALGRCTPKTASELIEHYTQQEGKAHENQET